MSFFTYEAQTITFILFDYCLLTKKREVLLQPRVEDLRQPYIFFKLPYCKNNANIKKHFNPVSLNTKRFAPGYFSPISVLNRSRLRSIYVIVSKYLSIYGILFALGL